MTVHREITKPRCETVTYYLDVAERTRAVHRGSDERASQPTAGLSEQQIGNGTAEAFMNTAG